MADEIRSTILKRDASGQIRHGGEWLALWSDPKSMQSAAQRRADTAAEQVAMAFQTAVAASLRSVAGDQDLEVRFSTEPAQAGNSVVTLPPAATERGNHSAVRGHADAIAGFLRHHHPETHAGLRPADPDAARLFDLLEQARCEGLLGLSMPGTRVNLNARHLASLRRRDLVNAHLASLIPLADGVQMVLRDTFSGVAEPSVQTAGMRMWDRWLRAHFAQYLEALRAALADQAAYGATALSFLEALFRDLPSKGRGKDRRPLTPQQADDGGADPDAPLHEGDDLTTADLFDPGEDTALADAVPHAPVAAAVEPAPYRAFTTRHDRVTRADALFDAATLTAARRRLDQKQAAYRQEVARISNRLQRRLTALQTRRWEFDREEGLIDASRLDRIVTAPGFTSAYKAEAESPFKHTLVTLLVDNSGSMRGKPVETACVVADILAAALERCDVTTEVLGFTTRGWKGGESAKEWKRAGRNVEPGRLNDLLHIVYKDADTPLRRARDSICAMLEPSLLKENIDGEALLWAASRALARPEQRRLLIVISDGAPVDQATLEANSDKRILDRHLRAAISWITRSTPIELAAIGLKHDVSGHYANAVCLEDVTELGAAIVGLVDRRLVAGVGR